MNLLLDTQILIWYLDGSSKLRPAAKRAVAAAPKVYVSAATIFEIIIKGMNGKLKAPANLVGTIREKGFIMLDISGEAAEAIANFPLLARHDPFDRLLLAQAGIADVQLLTADEFLLKLGLDNVLDAKQ